MLSYRSKLLLNFTLVFLAFAAVLIVFQQHREKTYRRELVEARLHAYADLVAGIVGSDAGRAHERLTDSLRHVLPADLRLSVMDRRGTLCYDSDGQAMAARENHALRPEVHAALEGIEGSDIRDSESTGKTYFYYARTYGPYVVRAALPYDESLILFLQADHVFLWFVVLLFPVVLVMLVRLSGHFGKSVAMLRRFTDSAERGLVDYDRIRFPRSELGDVGRTVMAAYRRVDEQRQALDAERERLLRHFHYFDEGIAMFTPRRECIYANPRFMQYANVILDRPTPRMDTLWQSQAFAPAREFIDSVAMPKTIQDMPLYRFRVHAGGSIFGVQVLVYAARPFEVTLTDVTTAEKTRVLKQQMSNNITHELRTPVSSIRGYLETLTLCPQMDEARRRHFLEKAYAQSLRLSDLIRDVALITKTDEAPDLMPREDLAPADVIADVADELAEARQKAGMDLVVSVPADARMQGNYTLVHSIFRNLMENSLRYAGHGCRITIDCYNQDAEYLYFTFADNGCGVPDEHLPRLFERFYRVTEGRTRDGGGTGLGLSIVRNAVLFHGGSISVRNARGGGLEFVFSLHK